MGPPRQKDENLGPSPWLEGVADSAVLAPGAFGPVLHPKAEEHPLTSHILVIDDTEAIHADFRKILASTERCELDQTEVSLFGGAAAPVNPVTFVMDSAHQGREGLDLLQRALSQGNRYAVAFVDIRMPPGWDGVETISQLWAMDPDLQVVICTAFSDYSWAQITDRFGATDKLVILKKPFDNIEVLQLAHALARKWQLTQQSRSRLEELDRKVAERTQDLSRAADHVLRLNRLYSVLSKINELIVHTHSMKELCTEACRVAVEDGLFRMAWIGKLQPGVSEIKPFAHWGMTRAYSDALHVSSDPAVPEGLGPAGTAVREGTYCLCNDTEQDPRVAPWRELMAPYGYRSVGAFPLKVKNRAVGVLVLYSLEPGFFNEEEVRLLDRLAADLSFAFEFMEQAQQLDLQRAALESAANSIVITDPLGVILWHNAAFTALTGYSRDEVVGKNASVLRSGKHETAFYRNLWESISAGKVWRGEIVNRRKDGSLYIEEMTITPVLGDKGVITHYVAIKQDITERKGAELRITAFSSLGQKLSAVKSVKEAAQIVVDVADELIGWDACSCNLYYGDEDVMSQVLRIDIVEGQRKELTPRHERRAPTPVARRTLGEGGILLLRDGQHPISQDPEGWGEESPALASLLCVPIRNSRNPIGLLSIRSRSSGAYNQQSLETLQALADHCGGAFERIRAEETLHATQEQLRQSQKLEAIGQLAGGVAHDFNNLLAVIRGNAELVLMDAAQGAGQVGECLNQVVSAADRAANLTRQLLAFSRKQIMQSALLDLNEVVGNLTKMLKRIIGEHIQLECHYAAQLPPIRADVGMLEQVLINLLVNARDAMTRGGQLVISTATVGLDSAYAQDHAEARPGHFVTLTVKDTGQGISPEHLPHIFEPFFTTKEVGKGTGLGLATVYGIVKQHGGWIGTESEPGQGATFTIFLPAMEPQTVPLPPRSAVSQPVRGTETILLVEDEDTVRSLTRRILETCGYRVHEASCGLKAFELVESQHPDIDLLLTDVIMPGGLTGRDVAERLKAQNPSLKVIFTSGYSGEVLGRDTDFIRRTHGQFLPKPCSPSELLQAVRRALDQN